MIVRSTIPAVVAELLTANEIVEGFLFVTHTGNTWVSETPPAPYRVVAEELGREINTWLLPTSGCEPVSGAALDGGKPWLHEEVISRVFSKELEHVSCLDVILYVDVPNNHVCGYFQGQSLFNSNMQGQMLLYAKAKQYALNSSS